MIERGDRPTPRLSRLMSVRDFFPASQVLPRIVTVAGLIRAKPGLPDDDTAATSHPTGVGGPKIGQSISNTPMQERLMSDANKATLTYANTFVSRGDHEGFLTHCTDDTVWHFLGDRTLRGKEAVRQYMRETYAVPPRFHADLLVAEGDRVVVTGEITLTDAAGKATRYAYADVWRFAGGKIAELHAYVVPLSPHAD